MLDRFLFNKPQRFPSSVASATGCGSVITLNEDCVCHKLWEPSERSKSSTWRELAAIDFPPSLLRQFWKVHSPSGALIARRWLES